MSDRICIASGGREQVLLSANDLMSCCKNADGLNIKKHILNNIFFVF